MFLTSKLSKQSQTTVWNP